LHRRVAFLPGRPAVAGGDQMLLQGLDLGLRQ
jgi:hypothetical protein